jgi:glucose/arabinose dehydrogenase
MFPPDFRGDLFIALHGSWNRRVPVGYGVVRVHLEQGRPVGAPQPFLSGFREGNADALQPAAGRVWGRPVGLLVLLDGSLLVSDDEGGTIYRVTYGR